MAHAHTPPFGPIPPYSLQRGTPSARYETVTGARSQDIVPIITNRCALVLALSSTGMRVWVRRFQQSMCGVMWMYDSIFSHARSVREGDLQQNLAPLGK